VDWLADELVCCCILTREYASQSIIADHFSQTFDDDYYK